MNGYALLCAALFVTVPLLWYLLAAVIEKSAARFGRRHHNEVEQRRLERRTARATGNERFGDGPPPMRQRTSIRDQAAAEQRQRDELVAGATRLCRDAAQDQGENR